MGEEEDLGSLEQGGQLLDFEENEQQFEQVAAPQEVRLPQSQLYN